VLRTKHYDRHVRVSQLVVGALLIGIAIQVALGGARFEAIFEAGVIVGAFLPPR
jgi:hypothetical protein